ncbi:MAG: 7-cyano-7-deazaguanine synthase QueC [Nitrospinae bacterium RIFCSPLOWO2_12_39_16]|nr:MAG: 7-cyano-7-deazaguanine synthase QueC [Nitrospinae bacterium RIFCSPLOWO2_02_39_17]OGW10509.1 MAG: 7-cyano-7-deazaguanine synthase QueC [Nitrospinae bacterium RIFCSPLOWO2_12_39_16]HLA47878.1 7-cyano-7-deazaguanine synthase QueC [Nitrospinota bacterium]
MHDKKAVVLSSGGIDSTTAMAIAKAEGYKIYSLSFNYGQRHSFELKKASEVAKFFNAKAHLIINVDLRKIGGSALTSDINVPQSSIFNLQSSIPITYVPARNTIFLSLALAWAEVLEAEDIFIGVNAIDYSGYPDCRPEYINAFEKMANLATKAGVEGKSHIKIHTPLINLTKGEIIKKGILLGVDYSLTSSCYSPDKDGNPCGLCDSCQFRLKGFKEAGIKDPLNY